MRETKYSYNRKQRGFYCHLCIIFLLFSFSSITYSQLPFDTGVSISDSVFWNNKMTEIATLNSSPGWVRLKDEVMFTPDNFFSENKEAFGLKQDDNMVLVKTISVALF